MNRYGPFNWILLVLSSLILLFLLAPLLGLFLQTGASEFFETAKDKEVQDSIWLTIWVSFSATFFFAIAAVPFSWLLARKSFPLKGVVQ
jgi:ABC-type sulfate transport system permease component